MVWADAASPKLKKAVTKHHHKKPKNTLNPQPHPPRKAPGTSNDGKGFPTGEKTVQ